MANLCAQCGKRNNPFAGEALPLGNGRCLCSTCVRPIRNALDGMYYVRNDTELTETRNKILSSAQQLYSQDIIDCIDRIAVQRGKSSPYYQYKQHHVPSGKVGNKIETLASIFTALGVVLSIILMIVIISIDSDLAILGIIISVLGCIMAWLSNLLLHGFGRLVSSSERIVELLSKK
ncbi:MAG: hypothetical protein IJO88_08465 [Oscillospiraceae bacterium]|nr:hypothetical protein [Oscillospiraceae bacterium]